MTAIELTATLLGLANIVLIVRRSIWNFPAALAMVSLYAMIFWDAKLYSDAGLQVFFFGINLYGWWAWGRTKADAGEIVVERLAPGTLAAWAAGSVAATLAWGAMMARLTDATHPYWDGAIAMFSIAAQILMTRRFVENWWWWIAVNCLSVPLYLAKGLNLTAALYGLFLILAIWGLIEWKRHENHLPART